MRIKFKRGKQKWFIEKAIYKAGSERKLGRALNIPYQSINFWRTEKKNISDKTLNTILKFLNLNITQIESFIETLLDDNWGRKKGGLQLIKKHKDNGTYTAYIKFLSNRGKKTFSNWHRNMRLNDPDKYYQIQHNRFKKIGHYKFTTLRGEIVRNRLEKVTADFLYSLNLKYEYEPYVVANGFAYFPDFKTGNLIIECTAWRGYLKVGQLKKKIRDFKKEGYNIRIVIIPEIEKFYKPFGELVITNLDQASVAQTIRQLV